MTWKYDILMQLTLSATDIVPLMNIIFYRSHNNVAAQLKVVSDRGWFPTNRKLLKHPSLVDNLKNSANG